MGKKKSKSKNLLERYNEKPTKGNIENSLLKGAVDTVAGSVIGTGLGALTGEKAAFAGIALIIAGHYLGDESGLLRLTGASTMAYGIGKANEYKNNPELNTPNKRLSALKDDWLSAFHLKWKQQTEIQEANDSQKQTTPLSVQKEIKPIETQPDLSNSNKSRKIKQGDPFTSNNEAEGMDDTLDIDFSLF